MVGGMLHREFFKNLKTNFILFKVLRLSVMSSLKKKKKSLVKKLIDDVQLEGNAKDKG